MSSSSSSPFRLIWSLGLLANLLIVQHCPTVQASSSYGGGNSLMSGGGGGYGSSGGSGYGGGGGGASKGPYTAAVETSRTVEVKPVQSTNEQHEPHIVEVPGDDSPVIVHFKSQSSRVLVQQTHQPAPVSEPEHTSSEDEPQRVIHEVVKPVIQEIREVIQPYRRLLQSVMPVIETTHTIIAKGEPRPAVEPLSVSGASGGNSGSSGSGSGRSGSSGKSSYGGSSGSGGYAAAASTSVSLKSSAPSSSSSSSSSHNPVSTTESRSQSVSHQVTSSSSTYHQPQSHHPSSGSNNRKYTNAQIQQIFQQSAQPSSIAASSQYSARRGDLRESQYAPQPQPQAQHQQQQPTQTRISLRPAPVGYSGGYYRKPVVQAVHQQQPQQSQQQQIHQSIQQVLSHIQPMSEIRGPTYYAYSDYQGAVSSLHEDDIPLLTFVAKPTRFRARARAAAAA